MWSSCKQTMRTSRCKPPLTGSGTVACPSVLSGFARWIRLRILVCTFFRFHSTVVAAQWDEPHFSRVLSIALRAHANSLRTLHGYARTYRHSWPIRPSRPTSQSGRLSACHAKAAKYDFYSHSRALRQKTSVISKRRSECCIF